MRKYPKVSIVIPLYVKTPYFYESVGKCLELDYPNFEVLIGVDGKTKVSYQDKRVKILRTGEKRTGPAEKRDICLQHSSGKYVAFLDDDSFPEDNWLKKSVEILECMNVSTVCGPGLTPPGDSFSQKITGSILSSKFGSGPYFYRFTKGNARYVDDYPAYNMIVDKNILKSVGGWGTKFYGGEDTALCLKIINSGEKIYYHPDIVVYHHRRRFPFEYVRQVGNVGLHRGFFVKAYPETSLRISYFAPALFTLFTPIVLLYSIFSYQLLIFSVSMFSLYYVIVFLDGYSKNSLNVNLILPVAVAINHFSYGWNFIKGLVFTKNLER
jgi:glycosyltransferase involved in cell wall biosynthesis